MTRSATAWNGGSIWLGFAPWIIYNVVASPSTWKFAALAALIASVVLNLPDLRRGQFKILEAVGIVFFGALCVLGLFLDRDDLKWLETYAQVLSSAAIALVALLSLASVPFTEQYARESVAREYWHSSGFRHINRVLTAVWCGVFVVTAILGLVAVHAKSGSDWLNWVIPVALLVLAVRFTSWYPEQDHAKRSSDRA